MKRTLFTIIALLMLTLTANVGRGQESYITSDTAFHYSSLTLGYRGNISNIYLAKNSTKINDTSKTNSTIDTGSTYYFYDFDTNFSPTKYKNGIDTSQDTLSSLNYDNIIILDSNNNTISNIKYVIK